MRGKAAPAHLHGRSGDYQLVPGASLGVDQEFLELTPFRAARLERGMGVRTLTEKLTEAKKVESKKIEYDYRPLCVVRMCIPICRDADKRSPPHPCVLVPRKVLKTKQAHELSPWEVQTWLQRLVVRVSQVEQFASVGESRAAGTANVTSMMKI